MLEIVPHGLHIDFLSKAKLCIALSLLAILVGMGSIVVHGGLNLGIDFSGGTLLQLRFDQPADLGTIRDVLNQVGLEESLVQHFGDEREVLIRVPQVANETEDIGKQVLSTLQERLPDQRIETRRTEVVGPQVSADLRQKALFAMFYAILAMVIYISGRFEAKWFPALGLAAALFTVTYTITQWIPDVSPAVLIVVALAVTLVFCLLLQLRYALAAIAALIHDVLITVGCFSLLDKAFSLQIIAALLTIIGFSLNDTIVIFDRIRENMHGQRREQYTTVVNASVNQTLSRTILTTGTVLIVVVALLVFGSEVTRDFAFALLVGMIAGTYSTVFIASALLVYWPQRGARRAVSAANR
jgi:preprotein translocase subunit SecF